MGIFPDPQGQLTLQSLVRSGRISNLSEMLWMQICKKTTIHNTNVDLVNDDVYTKFGLILSIHSQDIE